MCHGEDSPAAVRAAFPAEDHRCRLRARRPSLRQRRRARRIAASRPGRTPGLDRAHRRMEHDAGSACRRVGRCRHGCAPAGQRRLRPPPRRPTRRAAGRRHRAGDRRRPRRRHRHLARHRPARRPRSRPDLGRCPSRQPYRRHHPFRQHPRHAAGGAAGRRRSGPGRHPRPAARSDTGLHRRRACLGSGRAAVAAAARRAHLRHARDQAARPGGSVPRRVRRSHAQAGAASASASISTHSSRRPCPP